MNDVETETKATWSERAKAFAMVSFPSIWPFINFLNINRAENYSELRLGIYCLGTLFVMYFGFLLFRLIFGKVLCWNRSGVIFAIIVVSFFCYSITYTIADEIWQRYHLKTWLAFTILMVLLAWYLSRAKLFQNMVFVLGVVLVFVPTAQYLVYQAQLFAVGEKDVGEQPKATLVENNDRLPSVYHIILDEYGSADVLQEVYEFNNDDFLQKLIDRGFYIANKATSNYKDTGQSIPSILTMDYLFQGEITAKTIANSRKFFDGKGGIFDFFHDLGYFIALLRYAGTTCASDSPDYCFSPSKIIYGDLEHNLIVLTPLARLLDILHLNQQGSLDFDYFELSDVRNTVEGIQTGKPVFAHIHMLIPHGPQRFTRTCKRLSPAQQKARKDKSKNYIEQLECANKGSLELIDTILQRDSNSIIIIQSDHGPRIGVDTWEQSYSILNAWRIPSDLDCRDELHSQLTLVNTFRIVQGCVLGTPQNLLPARWFFKKGTDKYKYYEIPDIDEEQT